MHPIGNIFAWGIYILIGLSPLIYLKFIKKDSHKHDLILYILSIFLLFFLYFWINPGYLIYRQHQENLALFIRILFASILYTLIILYLILEFNERMKSSSNLSTLRIHRIGLISLQFLFVFMIFGPYLSDITNRIYTAYNPYYHQGNVSTFIFLFLRFISQILPLALS